MLSTFKTNFQEKFNNISFKTRAIGALALLSILPVATVGGLAYFTSYDSLKKTEIENQQFAVSALSDVLTQFITLRNKDAQTLAGLPLFDSKKIAQGLTLEDREGFLNEFLDRYTFFDGAMVLDLSGNPLFRSKRDTQTNYADQAYFQAVLKTGKAYVSKIETSKVTKLPSLFFAAPVKDSVTGELIGVLRLRMPITSLKPIVEPYATNSNQWHIIDKNTNKFLLAFEGSQVGRSTSDFSEYDRLKNSNKPESTFDIDRLTDKKQLISVLSMPKIEGLGGSNLGIIMAKDLDIVKAKENVVLLVLVLGTLTTGGIAVGLSLLLGNRITKFIQQLADSIVNSSEDIVATIETQEVTVNMQANSAIDTSKTVNELGAISFQSAAQAEASANGARQALSLSEDGTRAVQQTLQGMNGLRDKVDAIANQIVNLSEQTGQITIVSDLVADLASQTNMLALNAAVEAARAGEQGRGFSVVADEIRKLADQSKKSADKINALAEDIQTAINRTVMVTDEGTKTVNEGIDLARSTAVTFAGVTDAVNNVFLNSQQISTSAKQQAVSIQQVLSSMTMISQGSQESAVGMHQVKMTTRELNQVADELKAAVV
jgi:methyl-accepting chemotaxis protein